jgi:hypothetical protein
MKSKKNKTWQMKQAQSKQRPMRGILPLFKQRKGVHEVSMGSLAKTLVTLKKHKGKEKVLEPIVESDEQVNFHSFESNGDVNFLIAPLDGPRKEKGGKQSLKCPIVDKSFEK